MTLKDIADLIRANSANIVRRMDELHRDMNGQVMNLQNDVTDVRADVKDVSQSLDLAGTVAEMKGRIGVPEA